MEEALMLYNSSAEARPGGIVLNDEFEQIRSEHAVLASTGCTKDFCQSGRVIHTDEQRGTHMLNVQTSYQFFKCDCQI